MIQQNKSQSLLPCKDVKKYVSNITSVGKKIRKMKITLQAYKIFSKLVKLKLEVKNYLWYPRWFEYKQTNSFQFKGEQYQLKRRDIIQIPNMPPQIFQSQRILFCLRKQIQFLNQIQLMNLKNTTIKQFRKVAKTVTYVIIKGQNQFEEALKLYDQAKQKILENADFYYNKGTYQFSMKRKYIKKLNRFEEALSYYDYAIQKNPEQFIFYLNKGINNLTLFANLLQKLYKFNKAQQFIDYSIEKNPYYADLYNIKACLLVDLNQIQEALKYYDYAIQKNPEKYNFYQQGQEEVLNNSKCILKIKSI